jgi:hypothetical protein
MCAMKAKAYCAANVRGNDEIIVGAFDLESEGLGGKILMMQWGVFGKVYHSMADNMVEQFLAFIMDYPSPVIWYAHFAQYDWRYFMSEFVRLGMDVQIHMRSDSAAYQITIKNKRGKKVVMRDSWALWPGTLKNLAESFCPELPKHEIDVAHFDPSNPEHVAYARRDVEILLCALPRLFALLHRHFGVQPSGTTAGTALKAWQSKIPAQTYFKGSVHNARELYIRSAYYGGLVFLTETNKVENAITVDRNSSYPASMCEFGVPSGSTYQTTEFQNDHMAIYTVRVRAPDGLVIPILPARNERGAMRWFRGEFITTVTNRELVFAANNGYKILEIIEGIAWEETIFPFNEIIQLCKEIRFKYAGLPEETLAKLMQNAIYGKFGSRRERLRVFAEHNATDEDFDGAEPYGDDGLWYIKKEFDEEMLCKPEWSVFITAHARLSLLQNAYSAGVENVLYGDTDSLTLRAGAEAAIDIGKEYGQWKIEKEWDVFRAIAPKVYSGRLKSGKFVAAAKGLPKKGVSDETKRELLEYGASRATVLSLDSLRLTLKNGVRPAQILTRASSTLAHSVNFERLPNGKVRPKIAS